MDGNKIRTMVAVYSITLVCEHVMVVAIVEHAELTGKSDADIRALIKKIRFKIKYTASPADKTYWATQSPFDDQWYLFASGVGFGTPTEPVEITPDLPSVMLEE